MTPSPQARSCAELTALREMPCFPVLGKQGLFFALGGFLPHLIHKPSLDLHGSGHHKSLPLRGKGDRRSRWMRAKSSRCEEMLKIRYVCPHPSTPTALPPSALRHGFATPRGKACPLRPFGAPQPCGMAAHIPKGEGLPSPSPPMAVPPPPCGMALPPQRGRQVTECATEEQRLAWLPLWQGAGETGGSAA
jgi:hypothetical protein